MTKPKILLYDIETSPNISYTWGKYEQNVIDFKQEWQLLSFSYKWLGKGSVKCITRLDFKDKSDKSITKALWKVLNQSDVVIAHNGEQFDNKKAKAKFIEHGLMPTQPFSTIDTRKVARTQFNFNSNKLDDLGKLLGVGRKIRIKEGFELWLKCMAGGKEAFKVMSKYNKQDVLLLEKVYLKMRPWIKHPFVMAKSEGCSSCGSKHLVSNGIRHTGTHTYRRFQCQDCGNWSRSRLPNTNSPKPKVLPI